MPGLALSKRLRIGGVLWSAIRQKHGWASFVAIATESTHAAAA